MVHGLDEADLVFEYFLECLQVYALYLVPLNDLNRIEARRILEALGQLNSIGVNKWVLLGVEAFAYGLEEFVLFDRCLVLQ